MIRAAYHWSSIGLLLAAAACDPQVGKNYPGEPLAELQGTIGLADGYQPANGLSTVILWHDFAESDSVSFAEPTAVEGTFPADFTVSLYAPPAEDVMIDLRNVETEVASGKRIAVGYVAVVPEGMASGPGSFEPTWEGAAGVADAHLLVYSEQAISAAEGASLEGGQLTSAGFVEGYQLFRIQLADNTAYDACMEAAFACTDACLATCQNDPACLMTCVNDCGAQQDPEECESLYQENDTLVPTALDDPLTITLGAEKRAPDWF